MRHTPINYPGQETDYTMRQTLTTLSVILPCYNAAPILESSVRRLSSYLDSLDNSWEIVIVNDGSTDRTGHIIEALRLPNVVTIQLSPNRGKGRAVVEGMLKARGDTAFLRTLISRTSWTLSRNVRIYLRVKRMPPSATASWAHPELRRRLLIRRASLLFKLMAGLVIERFDLDTQWVEGLSGPLAERLFPMLTLDGFAFDVEVCWLLHASQIEIAPVPVVLVNQDSSTVTILGSGLQAFSDVIRLGLRKLLRPSNITALRGVLQGENAP
jgi:dolichyl-phosphate beta-glucosyltransferase